MSVVSFRRCFSTGGHGSSSSKGTWEMIKEKYLLFNGGVSPYANYPAKRNGEGGFRHPSPASGPPAVIPTASEEVIFNTQYYTRDTTRNPSPTQIVSLLAHSPQKLEELGSPGKKLPAVDRYDPTGTRTAMTTSWKAMNTELAKRQPIHFPRPWWQEEKLVQEAKEKAAKNGIPLPLGIACRSLGAPSTKNLW